MKTNNVIQFPKGGVAPPTGNPVLTMAPHFVSAALMEYGVEEFGDVLRFVGNAVIEGGFDAVFVPEPTSPGEDYRALFKAFQHLPNGNVLMVSVETLTPEDAAPVLELSAQMNGGDDE
jgi:hypothetical protein